VLIQMLTLQSTSKQHLELTTETAIQEIKDGSPFWAHSPDPTTR
jgi:hypothetical protein